ncbi:hypothetical protein MPH_07032 [Macrophomina phaseolina MS6]|uniref:Uncharacterized protein n=1 Tax=Macrophomina phaseolina (strain MS6) TaxID=1126212 RepID=K2RSA9_MACPH|nr:hypothetical protein MPH_07032 [Macrophomina phaseolina MS6]
MGGYFLFLYIWIAICALPRQVCRWTGLIFFSYWPSFMGGFLYFFYFCPSFGGGDLGFAIHCIAASGKSVLDISWIGILFSFVSIPLPCTRLTSFRCRHRFDAVFARASAVFAQNMKEKACFDTFKDHKLRLPPYGLCHADPRIWLVAHASRIPVGSHKSISQRKSPHSPLLAWPVLAGMLFRCSSLRTAVALYVV